MDDPLIPKGTPLTEEQMAEELSLDLYSGDRVDGMIRLRLTAELDKAMGERGVSRDLLKLLGATRRMR